MKLTGNLKKQVEKAESKDEKKSLIENAGMLLNDEELEKVSGGVGGASKYCVEGYSEMTRGYVKMYVSTYEDAVKLCKLLGIGTEYIKEVKG